MTRLDWLNRLTDKQRWQMLPNRPTVNPWNVFDGENWWTAVTNARALLFLPGTPPQLEPLPNAETLLRFLPEGRVWQKQHPEPLEPITLAVLKKWCGPPWKECERCKGTGGIYYAETLDEIGGPGECPDCKGSGVIPTTVPCSECHGHAEPFQVCTECEDTGVERPKLRGWLCGLPIDRLTLAEYLWGIEPSEGDPLVYGNPGTEQPLWLVADQWCLVMTPAIAENDKAKKIWAEAPRLGEDALAWRNA